MITINVFLAPRDSVDCLLLAIELRHCCRFGGSDGALENMRDFIRNFVKSLEQAERAEPFVFDRSCLAKWLKEIALLGTSGHRNSWCDARRCIHVV